MASGLILALAVIPCCAAFEWDEFANNLATDLAPLITLFGEQVTKQFLSESLSTWDSVIFAMAPLGILTAVVSAIRVCGNSSLRAFIGRAQESPGTAEVELLSSTSETTSELWHEGGITRVFGSPQILELVRFEASDEDYSGRDYTAGICHFMDSLDHDTGVWRGEGGVWRLMEMEKHRYQHRRPNLSLNFGIKRLPKAYTYGAAALGIALQTGVLIFAALVAYKYPTQFPVGSEGSMVENYAFPLTLIGTILLCSGMFLCAFIIERSTYETYYRKREGYKSQMYFVQPGGQKIGDQVFEPFVGVSDDSSYIVSLRADTKNKSDGPLWITVVATVFGFIVQFVGLRAMHSSVIMAQLGATLLMAVVRAGLRTQRVAEDKNLITSLRDWQRRAIQSHELDFLAMRLEDTCMLYLSQNQEGLLQWRNTPRTKKGAKALAIRARLARLTSGGEHIISWKDFRVREIASQLQIAIEGVMEILSTKLEGPNAKARKHYWPIGIRRGRGYFQSRELEQETFTLRIHKEGLVWRADCSELEALIGTWACSIRCTYSEGPETCCRLISADAVEAKGMYPVWIQRRLQLEEAVAQAKNEGLIDIVTRMGTPLFGCQAPYNGTESFFRRKITTVWHVSTGNSDLTMCAQDIFIAFMAVVLRGIRDIGGETTLRTPVGQQPAFLLQNSLVEELVNRFEDSGLGSREDAYMCIIPLLTRDRKMPGMPDDVLASLRDHVKIYKKSNRFEEAVQLLEWICSSPDISETRKPYIELAELYHAGMRRRYTGSPMSPSLGPVIPGQEHADAFKVSFSGIRKMLQQSEQESRDSTLSIIARRYGWIGLRIAKEIGNDEEASNLKSSGATDDEVPNYTDGRQMWEWAQDDNATVVTYLMGKKAGDVNEKGPDGRTPLAWAAVHGNVDLATLLLENDADRNIRDRDGYTPLLLAIENGQHSLVRILLHGDSTSLNIRSKIGMSPLMLAAKNGDSKSAKILLQEPGIEINARSTAIHNNRTAFDFAFLGDHEQIVEWLVEKKAYISYVPEIILQWANEKGNQKVVDWMVGKGLNYERVLWEAVKQGHKMIVESLIKQNKVDARLVKKAGSSGTGGHPRKLGDDWNSLLSLVAGRPDIAELLIDQGMYSKEDLGDAAWNGCLELVELLVENGTGFTPLTNVPGEEEVLHIDQALFWATSAGHKRVVELIIEKTGRIHGKALELAVGDDPTQSHKDIVELLLDKGVDLTEYCRKAAKKAAETGDLEVIKILIGRGLDLSVGCGDMLQLASGAGHVEVVRFLIENGADLKTFGEGALNTAAGRGHEQVVKFLLEQGVGVGEALQRAARIGHRGIVEHLLRMGVDPHPLGVEVLWRVACTVGDPVLLEALNVTGREALVDLLTQTREAGPAKEDRENKDGRL
ncbi:hypothetical protein TWF730_008203 [Orbilia blumenaviensis]|uniref:Uncharacterized protein n=1 Tax=Orbilia blumenaviensis TaxID=1796055 RepID=A0AAV9V8B4_9PEZI